MPTQVDEARDGGTTLSPLLQELHHRVLAQQPALVVDTVEHRRFTDDVLGIFSADLPPEEQPDAVLTYDLIRGLRLAGLHRDHPFYGQINHDKISPAQFDLDIATNGPEILWNRPVPSLLLSDLKSRNLAALSARAPTRLTDPVIMNEFLSTRDESAAFHYVQSCDAYPYGAILCNRMPFCEVIVLLYHFGKMLRNTGVHVSWVGVLNSLQLSVKLDRVPGNELRPRSPALTTARASTGRDSANKYDDVTTTRVPIIVDNTVELAPDVLGSLATLQYPLPDREALGRLATMWITQAGHDAPSPSDLYTLTRALAGMTERQAVNAICLALTQFDNPCSEDALRTIEAEKMVALAATQLEYIPVDRLPRAEHIAGYDRYKEWLTTVRATYSREAADAGIPRPRGVLLLGIPGTGKSVTAMLTASVLGVPCVRLDFSALFQGIVGASESAMRQVLRTIRGLGDCVVFIDEIDKGLAGNESGAATTDSGVTKRIFGQLLSFMAENVTGAFVVMTANRVNALPPETFRLGRVDAVWFVDMPTPAEAEAICRVHLRKNRVDTQVLDNAPPAKLEQLRAQLSELVGSEIEHGVVIPAIRAAWAENARPVTIDDLIAHAAESMRSSIKTRYQADLDAIRTRSSSGARPVSSESGTTGVVVHKQSRTPDRKARRAADSQN